jgi:putative heme-binding domain-containing protein
VCVAPDGSLFVADFYNHIAGGRNLSQPWRGRIYRVLPKGHDGTYRVPKVDLATADGLVAALGSPCLAVRASAILKIKELGPEAMRMLTPHAKDANAMLRARVLFQLARLGEEGRDHVKAALTDPNPSIRVVAIRGLRQNGADMVTVAKQLSKDPSPQVRRELLIALRDAEPTAARDVLITLANQYDGQDRFYLEAVGIAFRGRGTSLVPALIESWPKDEWSRRVAGLLWVLGPPEALPRFVAVASDRQRDVSGRLIAVEALGGLSDIKAGEALASLLSTDATPELVQPMLQLLAMNTRGPWKGLSRNAGLQPALERLLSNPRLRADAIAVSRNLGTRPLAQWMLSQPFPSPKGTGFSKSLPPESLDKPELERDWTRAQPRPDGVVDVAAQRSPNTAVVAYAVSLVNAKTAGDGRLWVGSSGGIKLWVNGKLVHEKAGSRELAARQDVVPVRFEAGVNRILVKAEQKPTGWSFVVELDNSDNRLPETTDAALPKIAVSPGQRLDPKQLPPDRELLALKGDANRGRQVFLRSKANCASCHKVNGEGGANGVGPALDGIGVKMGRDAILSEILRPSQSIAPQYYQWTILTKKGTTSTGVIVEESAERMVLKDAQGNATTVVVADIEERTRSDVSIMPELLVGELSRQDLADLLQFLADLK